MQGLGWVMMVLWLALAPQTSMAVITINVTQTGANVEMTMSGSAKGLKPGSPKAGSLSAGVSPRNSLVVGSGINGTVNLPTTGGTPTGPFQIGSSPLKSLPTSVTGNLAGVVFGMRELILPYGYVSGTALRGTATYANQSICSLGLTPGTYTWTWGIGASADSMIVTIASPPTRPAPTVTSITPASGPTTGNTYVQIAGTDFCGVTDIKVGGIVCRNVYASSPTSASCQTPAGSPGSASVVVTTASGANANNSLFTYKVPPPTVSAVSPANGPAAGGTAITVTGTNLTGATRITVGGAACTNLNVTSDTTAACTTTANSRDFASVTVTTAGGSNFSNFLFSYLGDCTAFHRDGTGNYACIVPPGTTSLSYTVIGGLAGMRWLLKIPRPEVEGPRSRVRWRSRPVRLCI